MSFDETYFDREFYERQTGAKGAKRNQNNPFYQEFSARLARAFVTRDLSLLDIGCGMGWRTTNHFRNAWSAYGCDVSDWAYFNSVLPLGRHFCCDMRDLPRRVKRTFQVVAVERSIEYLPQEEAAKALDAIDAVATDYVVMSVICTDHRDPNVVEASRPGRLNMNTKAYWEAMCYAKGWILDKVKTQVMTDGGWDCIWVWRKPGSKLCLNRGEEGAP